MGLGGLPVIPTNLEIASIKNTDNYMIISVFILRSFCLVLVNMSK